MNWNFHTIQSIYVYKNWNLLKFNLRRQFISWQRYKITHTHTSRSKQKTKMMNIVRPILEIFQMRVKFNMGTWRHIYKAMKHWITFVSNDVFDNIRYFNQYLTTGSSYEHTYYVARSNRWNTPYTHQTGILSHKSEFHYSSDNFPFTNPTS